MRRSQNHHDILLPRRDVLSAALAGAACGLMTPLARGDEKSQSAKLKGRIKQSIIYHMQVQEGDVIATIRENIQHIAHFHTAGVPGRHEIDETQELYYPAVMRAIVDLKFGGYVAHEYNPTRDPIESLKQSVAICDV